MADAEYYKKLMRSADTTDYTTGEFLGAQATNTRRTSESKSRNSWNKSKDHVVDDWLGASPRKQRKSYRIKEKKVVPPPNDEKEEPAPVPAPTLASAPKEEIKAEEKKEEPAVDPEIAKYRAMMNRDEGNDYATKEFLGDQAATQRRSFGSSSPTKKWGKPKTEHVNNDWLGSSPGKQRKSYRIKEKKVLPPPSMEADEDKETPKEQDKPAVVSKEEQFLQEKTATAFSTKKDPAPKEEEPAKEPEVDPEIAKYRAMMHRDEGNDYATNEFLGEQATTNGGSYGSSSPAKKWGKPKTEHVNNDWLGASPGTQRKSYTIKGSSPKPAATTRASFAPSSSGALHSFASPVSNKPRASFAHFSPPKVHSGSPDAACVLQSPGVSEKERIAGRKSFSSAFAKFKVNDTQLPAAFAHATKSPVGTKSPGTKRNFSISKEAQAKDRAAHAHRKAEEEDHDEPAMKNAGLQGEQKKEYEEALEMLQKVFVRLDDREPSWKQMDAVIKKIKKATQQGADIKAILSYSISSLQHIAGLVYGEDRTDTDDVVEKLIDLNLNL